MKFQKWKYNIVVLILTAIMIFSSGPVFAAADTANTPKNLMVSLTGNGREMTVTWWNDESKKTGEILYGPESTLDHCSTAAAVRVFENNGYSVFEGTMTGLLPDKVYYYQVKNDFEKSPVKSFKTQGNNLQSFSFLYLGDVQLGESDADAASAYGAWGDFIKSAKQRNPDLAFGLQGGDLVDNGIRMGEWNSLLENASPVFSEVPFMPANGNHESNSLSGKPELYLKLFDLPKNGPDGFKEEFYSFDYGNSHITVLNSWVFSGEQKLKAEDFAALKDWLEKDLSDTKADWKIVVTHLPVYALHNDVNADAMKKNWAPIFEKCGVDLVLVGHQHVYSRSFPLYEGSVDYERGITYIMGNSGHKFYSSADERYSEKTIYNTSTYQIVHIDGNEMEVMTYDSDGNELDYWSHFAAERKTAGSRFADILPGAWYEEAVTYSDTRRLMEGTSSTAFTPGGTLTRAMFAAVLHRMAGEPKADSESFTDVAAGAWYKEAADWSFEKGIINGYQNNRFAAADMITREQLAVMLYRYAESMGCKTSGEYKMPAFKDMDKISGWSEAAVRWAAGNGFLKGRSGGVLDPKGEATRAECASILMQFDRYYSDQSGS